MPNRVRETVVDRIDITSLSQIEYDGSQLQSLVAVLGGDKWESDAGELDPFVDRETFGLETAIDATVVTNALNFQYGDHYAGDVYRTTDDGETYAGANGLGAAIERGLTERPDLFRPDVLVSMTEEDVRALFAGDPPLPWLEKRHEILTHLGERLQDSGFDGIHEFVLGRDVLRPFDGGDGLVEWLVSTFPVAFSDERTYRGEPVYFDKKAQLVCAMLDGRFGDGEPLEFAGMDELTVFADYLIPALFRDIGAFDYSASLARAIDEREYIPEDGTEEVELRIATVLAGEDLLELVNADRAMPLSPHELDYRLWSEARRRDLPHHLTRTTAY